MPILDVEIVLRPGEALGISLPRSLAARTAQVFGSPPGGTWVKVHPLASERYAENGGGPPPGVYPVFVYVLKAHLPASDQLATEAAALAQAVAAVCRRPVQNVHIIYQPPAAGRVAFGGQLLEAEPSQPPGMP